MNMGFENFTIIPSTVDCEKVIFDCEEKNVLIKKKNARKKSIASLMTGLSGIVCFVTFIGSFITIDNSNISMLMMFAASVSFIATLVTLYFATASVEGEGSPVESIIITYLLAEKNYSAVHLDVLEVEDNKADLCLAMSDANNIVEDFHLANYPLYRKTNIDKPLLDLNDRKVYVPYSP